VTFDRADLIDGTSLRGKQPHAGNGTEEKDPNGAIGSLRGAFYTENYSQISGNIFNERTVANFEGINLSGDFSLRIKANVNEVY
jgi:hypothetical protein